MERVRRGAIYTRISRDMTGEGAGIARQQDDCEQLAQREGIGVVAVYSDNDMSAYSSTPRPQYEALLQAIEAGGIDVVLVWHVDRLYRRTTDLERYVAVCQPKGVPTLAVQAGPLDLATPSGRMVARQLAAVAQYESEQKGERQSRANLQRARQGKFQKSRRPFGFEVDGVTIRRDEFEALRDAFHAVIDGIPLAAIARSWSDRGFRTPQAGNEWTSDVLGLMLRNPRHAGLRTYRREILRDDDGQPVRGEWDEVVDLGTFQATQAVLDHPSRKWAPQSRGLLSGIAVCDICDAPIISGGTRNGRRRYRCGGSGGHAYREAPPIDEFVSDVVVRFLQRPDVWPQILPEKPGVDVQAIRDEIAELQRRRKGFAIMYADGTMDAQQVRDGEARIRSRITELEGRLPVPESAAMSRLSRARDVEEEWAAMSIDEHRIVIDELLEVRIKSTGTKEKAYLDWRRRIVHPDSIGLRWKHVFTQQGGAESGEPGTSARRSVGRKSGQTE